MNQPHKKHYLLGLGTCLALLTLLLPTAVHAANAADFRAGRIIDDGVFTHTGSMSVAEIQNFLNSKVPTCDSSGSQNSELGGGTRAQYGASHGNPAPFTCLKDYYQNTSNGTDNYGGRPIPAGAVSAAQIIWTYSNQFNINPQVILATLQKENSLITDDWPFLRQFQQSMGFGCPDNVAPGAPACDPAYNSFSAQIYQAARHFRGFMDNTPGWFVPYTPGNRYVAYNPNSGCGGTNVNIENRATAALYSYTPYQPNAAALNNLYGTGDSCSAYGNRNFWRLFTDWFGSTFAPSYAWTATAQYAYTDSSKTTGASLANMLPGQRAYVGFKAKNLGNTTWTNTGANPINAGTGRPSNRASAFYDQTWLGYGRPARMLEASVAPGQTGTFEFWITAPHSSTGSFKEYFGILAENKDWMPDIGLYFDITVQPARYTWQLTSQYANTDETKTMGTSLANMQPGERKYVGFTARNTGNVTWSNTGPNPLNLGATKPLDRPSPFYDQTWLGYGRPARMKEATVAPGQTATFEFWITAPTRNYGSFSEHFNPVLESKAWLTDIGFNYSASVVTPNYGWRLNSQYAYSDSSKTVPIVLDNMTPGQTAYIGFTAVNTSNVTWRNTGNHPVDIGTARPYDKNSQICGSGWLGCNRPARMREASVAPGQIATFEFSMKAPMTPGSYKEYFSPVVEGITWLPDIGFNYYIIVR